MIRCIDVYDPGYKGPVMLRMDVKDPRFLVVDPDDCVRHDLILSATPIVELRVAAAIGSAFSTTLRPQDAVRASDNREFRARPRAVAVRWVRRRRCTCRTCHPPPGPARR